MSDGVNSDGTRKVGVVFTDQPVLTGTHPADLGKSAGDQWSSSAIKELRPPQCTVPLREPIKDVARPDENKSHFPPFKQLRDGGLSD